LALSGELAGFGGVSRRHALVTVVGVRVFVADLDSTNGTFVNGERLTAAPREVHPGDRIGLGSACHLVLSAAAL
jgi:pSer/pThr/pTyr-binding forkhead associated (FHA) protein